MTFDRKQNVWQPQQQNSAMVMLLSGSWQPDRQYNNGTKNTQLCYGTFAEPVRKIHVSNVRNQKNWKYMITASQNIKNYWKTPLEQKVMCLRQNHLFFYVNPGFPCWPKIWQWCIGHWDTSGPALSDISFSKHQKLLKNSSWAQSYDDLKKVRFFFNT